ncbi:MAG TPA: HepT-like ribonuclease domain-containing protein [Acidimicrobiales bacterium]|nr:HepT-like ribonuclease domain-containing protein [Acidimicrobiales bacterium]
MRPTELDREVIGRRLRLLRQTLADLRPLGQLSVTGLRDDPVRRAAIERFIQVRVDPAADVNAHIVVATLASAPATTAASFRLAADVGAVPVELAERLVPTAGLRNLLVHRYSDIDVALLAKAVGDVLSPSRTTWAMSLGGSRTTDLGGHQDSGLPGHSRRAVAPRYLL